MFGSARAVKVSAAKEIVSNPNPAGMPSRFGTPEARQGRPVNHITAAAATTQTTSTVTITKLTGNQTHASYST